MHDGYLRVAAVAPKVALCDVDANLSTIIKELEISDESKAEITLFPEMSLTGYSCGDLFHQSLVIDKAWEALESLCNLCASRRWRCIVGLPIVARGSMYNCAALIDMGHLHLVAKGFVPNYNEFYELRYWKPLRSGETVEFGNHIIFCSGKIIPCADTLVSIEICEDLWTPIPPSCQASMQGATVIFNPSASPDQIGKYGYLTSLLKQQSARCIAGYVYASAGWGESSTDLVFDGKAIIAENGAILASNKRWTPTDNRVVADIDVEALVRDRMHMSTFSDAAKTPLLESQHSHELLNPKDLLRRVDPHPFVPSDSSMRNERCEEIINIQVAGLARRLDAIGCQSLVVGVSGGLDSTLALLVATKTFDRLGLDRKGIMGVTMPGFGTTDRTHDNAIALIERLGITGKEISIVPAVCQHFADIGHDQAVHDVTYENSQARERTQLLMDLANQTNGIVLGTGDLSELALGWATYNGDQMSMYGVNAGVPKTLVSHLVKWVADTDEDLHDILVDIVATPISPELIPADDKGRITQKTEDLVGPYELHDFFLYYLLRYGFTPCRVYTLAIHAFKGKYDKPTILHWLKTFYRRFFQQQFKRSCMPDGPKVGSVCLSPRGDWRMPSDASWAMWKRELEKIEKS